MRIAQKKEQFNIQKGYAIVHKNIKLKSAKCKMKFERR